MHSGYSISGMCFSGLNVWAAQNTQNWGIWGPVTHVLDGCTLTMSRSDLPADQVGRLASTMRRNCRTA